MHCRFLLFFVWIPSLLSAQSSKRWTGRWAGTMQLPEGELSMIFDLEAADYSWKGFLSVPEQNLVHFRLDRISVEKKQITMESDVLGSVFEGRLMDTGRIRGEWKQNGNAVALELKRVWGEWPEPKPQTPVRPYLWYSEKFKIPTAGGRVMVAGELNKPDSAGTYPVVILVSGSGPQDRDGTIMGHKPFLVLTSFFISRGYAVMRYDDRGAGRTIGHPNALKNTTTEDLAADVREMLRWLKARPDVDLQRIGILGHSEGGLIAPMVAAGDSLAFLILMAAPSAGLQEANVYQNTEILKRAGFKSRAIESYMRLHRNSLEYIASHTDSSGWRQALDSIYRNWLSNGITLRTRRYLKSISGSGRDWKNNYAAFYAPWWQFALRYQPAEDLRNLKATRVLAVNGDRDIQVAAEPNLSVISACLNPKYGQVTLLPGLNHLFQPCVTCEISEYASLSTTLSGTLTETIDAFLKSLTDQP